MNWDFTADVVLRAYAAGIFPMGHDDGLIRWYSPEPRCIIDLHDFHVSKRLERTVRQNLFQIKINHDFDTVIRRCADREGVWITDDIIRVYTELHKMGFVHSVEAYDENGLAGGLYGVSLRGAFMGESMFHITRDASKVCLVHLVERLKQRGYVVLDTQYTTAHLRTFNAKLISRQQYLELLHIALLRDCTFV